MSVKNIIKKNKAFTLIEILIVIVIIGIIMTMTMGFGGNQIRKLRTKTIQETYLDDLNNIQSQMLTSNYYEEKKISSLQLTFKKNETIQSKIKFLDSSGNNGKDVDMMEVNHIVEKFGFPNQNGNISQNTVFVQYKPYHFGCKITTEDLSIEENKTTSFHEELVFQTKYKNQKICYKLIAATCKYKTIDCEIF